MTLFRKNPNETAYTGGKKHWCDVIKNTGENDLLIWRQPEEDFNTNSTLIVMPGETAIFVKGGKVVETFENGTYKLSTNNYPFISRIANAFTGGISTFNCVVYFVRKTDSEEIRWGTRSPIQVMDNYYGIRTDAKVRGAYKVRVTNPEVFMEKLSGSGIKCHRDDLNKYFAEEFQGIIKSAVSKFLNSLEQRLIGLDENLDELSKNVYPFIDEVLEEYGLKCVKFTLSGLDINTEKYDKLDEAQIAFKAKQKGYEADKAGLDILGDDWARVQSIGILKDMANNESGSIASSGAGIGMGIGAAEAFASITGQAFSNTKTSLEDPLETLSKLKKMLDAGFIEQSEYNTKKAEILSRM